MPEKRSHSLTLELFSAQPTTPDTGDSINYAFHSKPATSEEQRAEQKRERDEKIAQMLGVSKDAKADLPINTKQKPTPMPDEFSRTDLAKPLPPLKPHPVAIDGPVSYARYSTLRRLKDLTTPPLRSSRLGRIDLTQTISRLAHPGEIVLSAPPLVKPFAKVTVDTKDQDRREEIIASATTLRPEDLKFKSSEPLPPQNPRSEPEDYEPFAVIEPEATPSIDTPLVTISEPAPQPSETTPPTTPNLPPSPPLAVEHKPKVPVKIPQFLNRILPFVKNPRLQGILLGLGIGILGDRAFKNETPVPPKPPTVFSFAEKNTPRHQAPHTWEVAPIAPLETVPKNESLDLKKRAFKTPEKIARFLMNQWIKEWYNEYDVTWENNTSPQPHIKWTNNRKKYSQQNKQMQAFLQGKLFKALSSRDSTLLTPYNIEFSLSKENPNKLQFHYNRVLLHQTLTEQAHDFLHPVREKRPPPPIGDRRAPKPDDPPKQP